MSRGKQLSESPETRVGIVRCRPFGKAIHFIFGRRNSGVPAQSHLLPEPAKHVVGTLGLEVLGLYLKCRCYVATGRSTDHRGAVQIQRLEGSRSPQRPVHPRGRYDGSCELLASDRGLE